MIFHHNPNDIVFIPDAGFGCQIPWDEGASANAGHQMTFKQSLQIVSDDIFFKIAVPDWAFGLHERLSRVKTAFDELRVRDPQPRLILVMVNGMTSCLGIYARNDCRTTGV